MNTISISLGSNLQNFVNTAVQSGRYGSANEVVCAGIQLLAEREKKIQKLRTAINEGINSGFYDDFDFDSHLEELEKQYNG
ncbi:MAG: type II toxin-antitoxin system ParD family antitoxin [Bacteroidales bacterium]|nr:type II toxin-antitoxin system ParD family antitoxin [Bacteroidales bacterium]